MLMKRFRLRVEAIFKQFYHSVRNDMWLYTGQCLIGVSRFEG